MRGLTQSSYDSSTSWQIEAMQVKLVLKQYIASTLRHSSITGVNLWVSCDTGTASEGEKLAWVGYLSFIICKPCNKCLSACRIHPTGLRRPSLHPL